MTCFDQHFSCARRGFRGLGGGGRRGGAAAEGGLGGAAGRPAAAAAAAAAAGRRGAVECGGDEGRLVLGDCRRFWVYMAVALKSSTTRAPW